MEWNNIYDAEGQDGKENKKAYEELPRIMQYFISSQQKQLSERIINGVRRKYGEAGVKALVKTSGFRSPSVTSRHHGVSNSLHHFGLAIDVRKCNPFLHDRPFEPCELVQVVDSGDVWHIQFKRGSVTMPELS